MGLDLQHMNSHKVKLIGNNTVEKAHLQGLNIIEEEKLPPEEVKRYSELEGYISNLEKIENLPQNNSADLSEMLM